MCLNVVNVNYFGNFWKLLLISLLCFWKSLWMRLSVESFACVKHIALPFFFLDLVIVSRRAGELKGNLITWSNQCLHTENVTFSLFCKLNKKSSFRLHMIKKGLTDVKSPRKESSTLVLVEYIWITCNRYAHSKLRIFFPNCVTRSKLEANRKLSKQTFKIHQRGVQMCHILLAGENNLN